MPEGVHFQIGNFNIGSPQLLILAVSAALLIPIWILCNMYWKRRLTKWAESEHLELVRFRYAWFYEGPSAWTRSRNQHVFRVVTKDRNGLTRYCWIMFGTFWGFNLSDPLTKVEWSDDDD